jgi:hypothetical protein
MIMTTTAPVEFIHYKGLGWWFSLGNPVSSINKTDHHDITEILLKVPLNTITLTLISTNKTPKPCNRNINI